MKVGVIHRISDPQAALANGQALFEPQEGAELLQFCPSEDFTAATCIWESGSIDAVRNLVDPALGDSSEQTYFAIAAQQSVGLPEATRAAT